MDNLTLSMLGLLDGAPRWLKKKSPMQYKPKIQDLSLKRLIRDLQNNSISFSIPENTKERILKQTKFFNFNILQDKKLVGVLELDTHKQLLEIYQKGFRDLAKTLNQINLDLADLLKVNNPLENIDEVIERLQIKKDFILLRMEEVKRKADEIVNGHETILSGAISQARNLSNGLMTKVLSANKFSKFYKLSEQSISAIIPKLNDNAIKSLVLNKLKLTTPLQDNIALGIRDTIINTSLLKGKSAFVSGRELANKFENELTGVFNSVKYRGTLIARTNIMFAYNQSSFSQIKSIGARKFIVIGSQTDPECPICPDLWGRIYDVEKDADKLPIFHPNCRCIASPYITDEFPLDETKMEDGVREYYEKI